MPFSLGVSLRTRFRAGWQEGTEGPRRSRNEMGKQNGPEVRTLLNTSSLRFLGLGVANVEDMQRP